MPTSAPRRSARVSTTRSELFTVLRGRAQYYMISGQPKAAQELSRRCVEITEGEEDDGIAIETDHMFWTNGFFMGDCAAATEHADRAMSGTIPIGTMR